VSRHAHQTRRLRFAVGLALALGATIVVSSPVAAKTATPNVPVLSWRPCDDGFECATATVPLDYEHPAERTISLALIRQPATDPGRRIGSLFLNNGGPGNSPVDFVRTDMRGVVPADVQARFDVVGFDPRGVGASTPIRCFADADEQQAFFGPLPAFPVGAKEERAYLKAMAELGRRCEAGNGTLLAHVSTANVARDMDLLRRAVGDQQLTYAGYSYGTFLGNTYANLFPGKVRALLLDGVLDPVGYTTGSGPLAKLIPFSARVGSAETTADALHVFLDSCQAHPDTCAFAAPDTRGKFDAMLERLRRDGPVTVETSPGPLTPGGPVTVSYAFIVDGLRGALQFPPIWPDLAALYEQLDQATPAPSAAGTAASAAPAAVSEGDGYDNSREALLAVTCSETVNPAVPALWPVTARVADAFVPYFGADWTWLSAPCATWPVHDGGRYSGPFTAATAHPVLFVNLTHDAASNPANAATTAARLPGSRLLLVDGVGHPSFVAPSACRDAAVATYLVDLVLPAAGTTCPSDTKPFE
jgi:pimeloyl-ACP methyl ester carboxylesterase